MRRRRGKISSRSKTKERKTMTQAYILNMANHELLNKIEQEKEILNKSGRKTSPRLERYYEEEKELHQMILEAEKK
jgi:hypothetical protein